MNEIYEVFNCFLTCLELDKYDKFDEILTSDCTFDSSTLGKFSGINQAKDRYRWKGHEINYYKTNSFNNVVKLNENKAEQIAYVVSKVGYIKNNFFHYFIFGGRYLNKYLYKNGCWLVDDVKYCEDIEYGNTVFASNWWTMIDYTIPDGFKGHCMDSKTDNPWISFPNMIDDDETKIKDIWNKYCWGIDERDIKLTESVLTEDIVANFSNSTSIKGRDNLLSLFIQKREKENVMSHIGRIESINKSENYAEMEIWRYEPHRMGTKFLTLENKDNLFFSVKYKFKCIKENNCWKAYEINYDVGVFEVSDISDIRYL